MFLASKKSITSSRIFHIFYWNRISSTVLCVMARTCPVTGRYLPYNMNLRQQDKSRCLRVISCADCVLLSDSNWECLVCIFRRLFLESGTERTIGSYCKCVMAHIRFV